MAEENGGRSSKEVRKHFALRLSGPVFDGLQRWADDELRSLNAQIEYLLREALRREGRLGRDERSSAE